jgi:hypothetical protein
VSDPDRPDAGSGDEEPPADEEYARAYAAGYEEGVRSALREILQHTARGHTAQELRILAESRLARLGEETELKRRSVLGPPRRPAWNSLLRPPTPARPAPTLAAVLAPGIALAPGRSVLVREERPQRAVDAVRAYAAAYPRTVLLSMRPPPLPELAADRRIDLDLGGSTLGGIRSPGELGGQLRGPLEAPGGALVYVDALEFLVTEHSLDTTLRFVTWLVNRVGETGSALVVSFDRRSLDTQGMSRLERPFALVV